MSSFVEISRPDGERDVVACIPTPVAGLVLALVDGTVAVTHARSGLAIAAFTSAESAAEFVLHDIVRMAVDWTLSGSEILAAVGTRPAAVYDNYDTESRCVVTGGWGSIESLSR